jgi:hypothetical protein
MPSPRRKPTRRRRSSSVAVRPERGAGRVSQPASLREPSGQNRGARHAVAALRRGREALVDIEGQLDSLMALLREPSATIDAGAADRLAGATRKAHHAMSELADLGRLF